jgi:hypothetical protein
MQLRTHDGLGGRTVGSAPLSGRALFVPPPPIDPLVGASRVQGTGGWPAFSRWTEMRKMEFIGGILGTYSAVPCTAPCRRSPRKRSLRCDLAVESWVEAASAQAALGMPAQVHYSLSLFGSVRSLGFFARTMARKARIDAESRAAFLNIPMVRLSAESVSSMA